MSLPWSRKKIVFDNTANKMGPLAVGRIAEIGGNGREGGKWLGSTVIGVGWLQLARMGGD